MGFLQIIGGVLVGLFVKELLWAAAREWLVPWIDRRKERKYINDQFKK